MISFGVNVGAFYAISTLLDQLLPDFSEVSNLSLSLSLSLTHTHTHQLVVCKGLYKELVILMNNNGIIRNRLALLEW